MEDKEFIKNFKRKNINDENPKNIDYNNGMNILSALEFRIKIPQENHKHPLVYCYCSGQSLNDIWKCGKCLNEFFITIPCFICTCCNYHLCQKCFLCYRVKEIELLNDKNPENKKCENHKLMPITICNNHHIPCSKCSKDSTQCEYYQICSNCNYLLCSDCE